jgi:tetratricopeptide (TPR) repeat protein
MYIPAAFFSLSCLSAGTANVSFRGNRFLSGFVVALLILFFAGTFQRNLVWQDNSALFADTVEKSPDFVEAKNELALALLAKGQKEAAYDILRDIDLPDFQVASLNRIMVLSAEGALEEARSLLIERLQNPGYYKTTIQIRLVSVLEKMINQASEKGGERVYREEALYYLGEIWERTQNPFYLYRMGQFQLALGDLDKARNSFAMAAKLLPKDSLYSEPARKLAQANKRP